MWVYKMRRESKDGSVEPSCRGGNMLERVLHYQIAGAVADGRLDMRRDIKITQMLRMLR
jgi:hypothetical protein